MASPKKRKPPYMRSIKEPKTVVLPSSKGIRVKSGRVEKNPVLIIAVEIDGRYTEIRIEDENILQDIKYELEDSDL